MVAPRFSMYNPCCPDGIIATLHCHNPFSRTMALGLTQPPTEMSTRNISWVGGGGKGGHCVRLTKLPPSRASVLESGSLNLPETTAPVRPVHGLHKRNNGYSNYK